MQTEKKETPKHRKKERKWSKNGPQICQGAKKACVPSLLQVYRDNLLYSEYQVFVKEYKVFVLDMQAEIKSLLLSLLSFFFSIF